MGIVGPKNRPWKSSLGALALNVRSVVTSTIILDGNGVIYEHPGGYDDWLSRRKDKIEDNEPPQIEEKVKQEPAPTAKPTKPKKLTLKERKELEAIPAIIEKLEAEQAQIVEKMAGPHFYQKDFKKITETKSRLAAITEELAKVYDRWEVLEKGRVTSLPGPS